MHATAKSLSPRETLAALAALPVIWLAAFVAAVGVGHFLAGCLALAGAAALLWAVYSAVCGFTNWLVSGEAIRQHRRLRKWVCAACYDFDRWCATRDERHAAYHLGLAALSLGRGLRLLAVWCLWQANRPVAWAMWYVAECVGITYRFCTSESGKYHLRELGALLLAFAVPGAAVALGVLAYNYRAEAMLAALTLGVLLAVAVSVHYFAINARRIGEGCLFCVFAAGVLLCELCYEVRARRMTSRTVEEPKPVPLPATPPCHAKKRDGRRTVRRPAPRKAARVRRLAAGFRLCRAAG